MVHELEEKAPEGRLPLPGMHSVAPDSFYNRPDVITPVHVIDHRSKLQLVYTTAYLFNCTEFTTPFLNRTELTTPVLHWHRVYRTLLQLQGIYHVCPTTAQSLPRLLYNHCTEFTTPYLNCTEFTTPVICILAQSLHNTATTAQS